MIGAYISISISISIPSVPDSTTNSESPRQKKETPIM